MEIVKYEFLFEGFWEFLLLKLLIGFVGIRLILGLFEKYIDMLNGYYVCKKKYYLMRNLKYFLVVVCLYEDYELLIWYSKLCNLILIRIKYNFYICKGLRK